MVRIGNKAGISEAEIRRSGLPATRLGFALREVGCQHELYLPFFVLLPTYHNHCQSSRQLFHEHLQP